MNVCNAWHKFKHYFVYLIDDIRLSEIEQIIIPFQTLGVFLEFLSYGT